VSASAQRLLRCDDSSALIVGSKVRSTCHAWCTSAVLFQKPSGEAGKEGGPERGRLDHLGADDGDVEDVGLELHEQRVGGGPAVDPQLVQLDARVLAHDVEHVRDLERDTFQRGSRQVCRGGAAGEPDHQAARILVQWGAPRPAKAGTRYTPAASGTEAARASTSADDLMTPSPSRSHCTTAPPMKTLPSSA